MFGALTIEGRDTTTEHRLARATTTLGRAADNDVCLQHPTVSLHHARIVCDSSVCRIVDLGSSNGTYVNGVELAVKTEHGLSEGDTIEVGPFRVGFRLLAGATVIVAPEPEATVVLAPPVPPSLVVSTPTGTREFPLGADLVSVGRD